MLEEQRAHVSHLEGVSGMSLQEPDRKEVDTGAGREKTEEKEVRGDQSGRQEECLRLLRRLCRKVRKDRGG